MVVVLDRTEYKSESMQHNRRDGSRKLSRVLYYQMQWGYTTQHVLQQEVGHQVHSTPSSQI
jgi:hypothetical protein